MRRKVTLNERQLKNIIKESVRRILNEMEYDDFNADNFGSGCSSGNCKVEFNENGDDARLHYNDGRVSEWARIRFGKNGTYVITDEGETVYIDNLETCRGRGCDGGYGNSGMSGFNESRKRRRRVLKEGTTDTRVQELWEELKQTVGVETMLDCIYDWSSSDDIEQWIGWFEDEGYLGEY